VGDHLWRDARQLLGLAVAAAAALGIGFAWRDGTLRRLWPLWVAWALAFLALVPAFYSERYSLALLPIDATLAGATFASPLLALVVGKARRFWIKPAFAVFPLAFSLSASYVLQSDLRTQIPVEVLDCAKTLDRLKRPGDRLLARKAHIGFHAKIPIVPFPFTRTIPDLARYAHAKNVRWLYYSWLEAELRPEYGYLLDTSSVVPGLTIRFSTLHHPAVLYEIGPEFGVEPKWFQDSLALAYHFSRARLLITPRDTDALYNLSIVARVENRLPEARDLLERATRYRPADTKLWLALGDIDLRMEDGRAGLQAYTQAAINEPSSVEAQIGLGWASLVSGDAQTAAMRWRPVIDQTRDVVTLERMVAVYHAVGDAEAESRARAMHAALGGGR